jgi:hypothetical protein
MCPHDLKSRIAVFNLQSLYLAVSTIDFIIKGKLIAALIFISILLLNRGVVFLMERELNGE